MTQLRQRAEEIVSWLVEIRRDLHMHPEIRYEEVRTAGKVAEHLAEMGVEHRTGVGKTGVVALIRGKSDGPTVALRADMDALPIQEQNDVAYKSTVDGKMHACSHETHVTMLLGVARMLAEDPPPKGNVKLLFQPAEEGGAGANAMIDDGALDDPKVDAIFAQHVYPDLAVGQIGLVYGTAWASTNAVDIEIRGQGTHAARPQLGRDPIVAAAHLIQSLQTIVSRRVDPLQGGVVTIGKIEAGTVRNVIPETAHLMGTVRALTEESRKLIIGEVERVAGGVAEAFDVEVECRWGAGYPVTVNHDREVDLVRGVASGILGTDNVLIQGPSMGGEDFSYYLQCIPGAIYRLGCRGRELGGRPLHSPRFDVDESVLPIGAALLASIAEAYLDRSGVL
jgi:amidohydrolase